MPAHKCDFSGLFMGIQMMWHCPPRKNYKYAVKVFVVLKGTFLFTTFPKTKERNVHN